MRRRALIAVAVIAAAGIAVALVSWTRHSGKENAAGKLTGPGSGAAGALAHCSLRTGDRFALAGRASVDTTLDLGRLIGGLEQRESANIGLRATRARHIAEMRSFTLDLEVLDSGTDGALLGARVRDLSGTVDGERADVAEPGVGEAFQIRLDERCGIREFGWRVGAPLEGARQQQSLVASLSFQLPGQGDGPRYQSGGFDATGIYRARNQLVGDALVSRVTGYERLFGDRTKRNDQRTDVRIEESLLRVQLAESRWLAEADRTQSLSFTMDSVTVGTMSLEASFRAAEPAGAVAVARDGEWLWGHLLDRSSLDSDHAMAHEIDEDVARLTLQQVLAAAASRIGDPSGNPADYVVLLSDWLSAHPEAIPELLEQIKSDGFRGQARLQAALFHAMATANTPETREALQRIVAGRDFPYGRRIDAAQVAALVSPPLDGFLETLAREAIGGPEAFDRGSMQLALGMLAATQADEHPELAAQACTEIGRILERAGADELALVHGLQAAGNAASDQLFPAIAEHLDDDRPAVREAAADAMRNMSAEVALPSVDARLAQEQDAAVRARLLDAATTVVRREGRAPSASLLAQVSEDAAGATSSGTFGRAIELLGISAEAGSGEAQHHLEQLFAAERDKGAAMNATRMEVLGRYVGTRWTRQ